MTDVVKEGAPGAVDVVIVGGGLAGLSLARHLQLESDSSILLLERRERPTERQKVGESTVQVGGHYLARILDLEEALQRDHLLKYNLRFHWAAGGGTKFEDYSQVFWRPFSNVCSYQVDRNRLEVKLEELVRGARRTSLVRGVRRLEIDLGSSSSLGGKPHRVRFEVEGEACEVRAEWIVDASGRARVLARKLDLGVRSPIRHGSAFAWVDGQVDVERLTERSRRDVRTSARRRSLGHIPAWLATNHFMGEGWWFWVIPLHGRTSLGLVFDHEALQFSEVSNPAGFRGWIEENLPLLGPELARRPLRDFGGFRDQALGCRRALDAAGWALTGEAGRFSDPLYSPGSDLIALHNTLIVDAIQAESGQDREERCRRHDRLLLALHDAYLPSYVEGYRALGDQETFTLKYAWELGVYFAFYVFPFVGEHFVDRRFTTGFLRRFGELGRMNDGVQRLVASFYEWKRGRKPPEARTKPLDVDLSRIAPLAATESAFYEMGLDAAAARSVLDVQFAHLEALGRWIAAHIAARVHGRPDLVDDAAFVALLDPSDLPSDVLELPVRPGTEVRHDWGFDAAALLDGFERGVRTPTVASSEPARVET